ncbi:MAG: DUF3419 family protein, partial [bacterium]|nr:DUF3419 family protein [bacterium]
MPGPELVQALATGGVRYSRVWEDHLLLEQGLAIAPGDDVLSVTSAGCNVLNLLLKEPRSVTAVDLNPAQGALCELAVAAVRHLSRSEFVHFLGVRDGGDRLALYRRLRPALTPEARAFWDRSSDDVAAGVIHCGRLERYFRTFQTEHLAALIAPGTIDALLALEDPEEQRRLFEQR